MARLLDVAALASSLALGGCELVKNTGEVCLVPEDVICDCEEADSPFECGLPTEYWVMDFSCRGTYPADISYTIDARLYTGGNGYAVKETCEVEVDGDRLRVKAKFWHKPERDAIKEPPARTTCEVGPLAAGTWVLEYGEVEAEVVISDDGVERDMVCVGSRKLHDGYAD